MVTPSKMKLARKQRGLTLQQLAERVGGVTFQHLQMIEVGKRRPRLELAYRIADELGGEDIREIFPIQQETA